jgi:hypothetical protein
VEIVQREAAAALLFNWVGSLKIVSMAWAERISARERRKARVDSAP